MFFTKKIEVTRFEMTFSVPEKFHFTTEVAKYKKFGRNLMISINTKQASVVGENDLSSGIIHVGHYTKHSGNSSYTVMYAETFWKGNITPDECIRMQEKLRFALDKNIEQEYMKWSHIYQESRSQK